MSLHIIIGFDGDSRNSKPSLVYAGPSFSEAETAMKGSTAVRFEVLRNPRGYRKNNPQREVNLTRAAEANLLAEQQAAASAAERQKLIDANTELAAQLESVRAELAQCQQQLADATVEPAPDSAGSRQARRRS